MNNLTLKETMAIELRYLGNTLKDVAEKTGTPYDTIEGWFKSGGKLFARYNEYAEKMNKKRREDIEEKLSLSDDEIYILGTNMVRQIQKAVQGDSFILTSPMIRAFESVWKMQRVMKGLPISVEKQDITTEVRVNSDEVIGALGLVEEDFKEENYGETLKRIAKYLASKGSPTDNS